MTKYETARARGLEVFDCALPQGWADAAARALLNNPMRPEYYSYLERAYEGIISNFVWCYDNSLLGFPASVSETGDMILRLLPDKLK